jgi:hypothetical protein
MAHTRDWQSMREMSARLLQERTGEDVSAWNRRISEEGFANEQELRTWLWTPRCWPGFSRPTTRTPECTP